MQMLMILLSCFKAVTLLETSWDFQSLFSHRTEINTNKAPIIYALIWGEIRVGLNHSST